MFPIQMKRNENITNGSYYLPNIVRVTKLRIIVLGVLVITGKQMQGCW